jgi:predicted MFS family arabinose efflux permease
LVLGVAGGIFVVFLAMFLKREPVDLEDGVESRLPGANGNRIDVGEADYSTNSLSLPQALRTGGFWLTALSYFSFASYMTLILTHVVPYSTDVGISAIQASTILSVMSAMNIAMRPVVGKISDIAGRRVPAIVAAVLGVLAMVWLIRSAELWMFYLFAVIFGCSWSGVGIIIMTVPSDIFGRRNLGSIMGALEVGFALGSAAGAAFGGFVYDTTGSYTRAFVMGAVAVLLAGISIASARRSSGSANTDTAL